MSRNVWTPQEDATLLAAYTSGGIEAAVTELPTRTRSAILQRAYGRSLRAPGSKPRVIATQPEQPEWEIARASEVIIAYRLWELRPAGRFAFLESVQTRALWPAGEPLEAHALLRSLSDDSDHHTGIFALKAMHSESGYRKSYNIPKEKTLITFGQVSLWGRVIEHEHGYRAEFAYPRFLFVPASVPNAAVICRALTNTYGCETDVAEL